MKSKVDSLIAEVKEIERKIPDSNQSKLGSKCSTWVQACLITEKTVKLQSPIMM